MADDKNKNISNVNQPSNKPAEQVKNDQPTRKIIIDDDDIATKDELKAARTDTKVDINSVLDEYKASIENDNKSHIRNVDKAPLSIPLTKEDTLPELAERIITDAVVKSPASLADELEDYSSEYRKVWSASDYYSTGNEMLKEALGKIDDLSKLVAEIPGVKEGVATVGAKHINQDNPNKVYSGEEGYRIFATLTSGVRRVTLWNSGITFNFPLFTSSMALLATSLQLTHHWALTIGSMISPDLEHFCKTILLGCFPLINLFLI